MKAKKLAKQRAQPRKRPVGWRNYECKEPQKGWRMGKRERECDMSLECRPA